MVTCKLGHILKTISVLVLSVNEVRAIGLLVLSKVDFVLFLFEILFDWKEFAVSLSQDGRSENKEIIELESAVNGASKFSMGI